MVAYCLPLHVELKNLCTRYHTVHSHMSPQLQSEYILRMQISDPRLPKDMARQEEAMLKSLLQNGKRPRSPTSERGGASDPSRSVKPTSTTFHCRACKKDIPVSDAGHKTSAEHLANRRKVVKKA